MTQPFENNNQRIPVTEISVLGNRSDFLRLAATGRKWVSKSMIIQMAKRPQQDGQDISGIRVGYTASKKVGNAVKRNRAKRRLREVVRRALPDRGRGGYDYVLIARPSTVELPFDHLIRDFNWCLKRLNTVSDQNNPSGGGGESGANPDKGSIK